MLAKIFAVATCVLCIAADISQAKVHYKVRCSEDAMLIELVRTEDMTDIYLEQLKHYPDAACRPVTEGTKVSLSLSLRNIFQCGVTRIANSITGRRIFYHRLVVESRDQQLPKEVLLVKCVLGTASNHSVSRRNVLPAGFQEPEDLEIIKSVIAEAPEPLLNVSVRQGGQMVTGELNVNPGTPLQMEIFLDKGSSPVYGLLVSYMQVTDTKSQEETIIFNGCSVDPYLFENFNTVDGDFLSAKFRAFKFPESTYVLFKGTVNVCLDKCRGVECSSGQIGYGRRRREINSIAVDSNKIFEVTMTTFIKVDLKDGILMEKGKLGGVVVVARNSPANETVEVIQATLEEERNQVMGQGELEHHHHLKLAKEEITEEFQVTVDQASEAATTLSVPHVFLTLTAVLCYHF